MARNSRYLFDIISDVVSATKTALGLTVLNYLYGSEEQIVKDLIQMASARTQEAQKYPVVCLINDFTSQVGNDRDEYAQANVHLMIATATSKDYHQTERYSISFKLTLLPIYQEFLYQLGRSTALNVDDYNTIPHRTRDRLDIGEKQLITDGQGAIDFIDAIEILDLELRIKNTGCYTPATPPVCADAVVKNSDNTYQTTVRSGDTLSLHDINFTDSTGITTQVPAMTDIVATPPTCAPVTYHNSDNSYSGSKNAGEDLSIPNITFVDSDGLSTSVPAVKNITATPSKTLDQWIATDGGFYIKHGVLPDNYSSFDIDPVQANNRIWFAKYNTATLYRNTFTTLANVATIAAGANITSNPRYYNGLLYAGTSGGQIKVIDAATDTVLATVALGVAGIIESICIDTVNNRLYCVTSSGAKVGFLWQFNIVAAPNYLTYVTDLNPLAPATTAVYVACDNVNQQIHVRALAANGAYAVLTYALAPVASASAIFPNTSQCRGFYIDTTFNEALMMSHDAQFYRIDRTALTPIYDSMPASANYSDTNRTMFFTKIPWETRKYFSIAVRTGTGNRYAITTR